MRTNFSGFFFVVLLLCLSVLAGCATIPKTIPLTPDQQEEATVLFRSFSQVKQPAALDADIRLGWDVLGSKGGVGATVQLQPPAFLRFAANDPLGRALFLAVSDGATFTLVDNRIGRVYQGRTDSKFWHSYVPETLRPDDLFFFLGGLLPKTETQAVRPAQDLGKTGFWYVWKDGRSMTHHILLDRRTRQMNRHLLFDPGGNLVLDLTYSAYNDTWDSGHSWPGHLQITGTAVTGTLTVQIEKIYSYTPKGAAIFHLVPPSHFTIEQVF